MKINKKPVQTVKNFLKNAPEKIKNARESLSDGAKSVGSEISASYSKAAINIDAKANDVTSKAEEILKTEFLTSEYGISNSFISSKDNLIRFRIGRPIEGFKNLYNDDKRACCYFDSNGNITQIFVKDNNSGEVEIRDMIENTITHYSKEDIDALFYYKYHPEAIHSKLRFGKDKFSGDWRVETERTIEKLEDIFSDKEKVIINKEPKKLYRALQDELSPEDLEKLQTKGAIFTEKSYCSTTTDLDVAKRFAGKNPIIEIDFPENAEYIDIEKIFNIDRSHWSEKEYFLDKNSSFLVTRVDKENNIIRVRYL